MQHAESFRDLVVYQKARAVALRFFELSKQFPKEERIGRMLQSMTDKADQFCGQPARFVREEIAEYFMTEHRSRITDNRTPITDHLSSY